MGAPGSAGRYTYCPLSDETGTIGTVYSQNLNTKYQFPMTLTLKAPITSAADGSVEYFFNVFQRK